jgi:uncharacterized membrane protein YkoI
MKFQMSKKKIVLGVAGLAAALAIAGGTAAWAVSDDDGPSVTGPEADRAVAAALQATGGGKANSVERDSEDGATWEVEVTKPDGSSVDVRLDAAFAVVVIEGDSEAPDSDSGDD